MKPKEQRDDLHKLYVDHLTTQLEKKSIGQILDFLAMYCGWENIYSYAYKKVEEKRLTKRAHGRGESSR